MSKPNPDVDYVDGYPSYPHYVLLPEPAPPAPAPAPARSRSCWTLWSACRVLTAAFILLLLAGAVYLVWPRDPIVDVRKVTLEDISLHTEESTSLIPSVTLDLSLNLVLKITNMNYFGVDYDSVIVHFSYRGDELGKVESEGGTLPARSSAMVAALLDLKGTQLLKHTLDLIVDVANNEVPIETTTVFSGVIQILMFKPHIEVRMHCDMLVDPTEKVILQKDCALLM